MSLNLTEAHAVNVVLLRLTGIRPICGRVAPTDEEVRAAALVLATAAYRRQYAGIRPVELEQDWPTEPLFAITRKELCQLAGRELTTDEATRLRAALGNSSIPDAVEAVLAAVLKL